MITRISAKSFTLLACLALAISGSFAAPVGSPESSSVTGDAGFSKKLLASIVAPDGAASFNIAGIHFNGPGVYPVPSQPPTATGKSVILLTPFSAKVKGFVGSYDIGTWPNEDERSLDAALSAPSKAAAFAARRKEYALPRGFIEVQKSTADTRVSEHLRLADFLTHDQYDVWPKYLVLDLKLVDKLELVIDALHMAGHDVKSLHVMSGFRTPRYNASDLGPEARSEVSRHIYGDAADVYPDDDGDGMLDDLTGDGRIDLDDARIVAAAADAVERAYPGLAGGVGLYPATSAHGPFVHIDTRGWRARWGL